MRTYHLKRTQILPISLTQAWEFFSSPHNLVKITPPHMKFRVDHISGHEHFYAGQIIRYTLHVLPGIRTRWVTEITHVDEPHHFIDVQRAGPYALWHHQHHFKQLQNGVEMTDELTYAIPYGIIGRLANAIFVARELNTIFNYRYQVLQSIFKSENTA